MSSSRAAAPSAQSLDPSRSQAPAQDTRSGAGASAPPSTPGQQAPPAAAASATTHQPDQDDGFEAPPQLQQAQAAAPPVALQAAAQAAHHYRDIHAWAVTASGAAAASALSPSTSAVPQAGLPLEAPLTLEAQARQLQAARLAYYESQVRRVDNVPLDQLVYTRQDGRGVLVGPARQRRRTDPMDSFTQRAHERASGPNTLGSTTIGGSCPAFLLSATSTPGGFDGSPGQQVPPTPQGGAPAMPGSSSRAGIVGSSGGSGSGSAAMLPGGATALAAAAMTGYVAPLCVHFGRGQKSTQCAKAHPMPWCGAGYEFEGRFRALADAVHRLEFKHREVVVCHTGVYHARDKTSHIRPEDVIAWLPYQPARLAFVPSPPGSCVYAMLVCACGSGLLERAPGNCHNCRRAKANARRRSGANVATGLSIPPSAAPPSGPLPNLHWQATPFPGGGGAALLPTGTFPDLLSPVTTSAPTDSVAPTPTPSDHNNESMVTYRVEFQVPRTVDMQLQLQGFTTSIGGRWQPLQ